MSTVNVTITLKQQAVPANPPASSTIRYKLVNSGGTPVDQVDVSLPATGATFLNVPDGTYTVTAQRLNNLNVPVNGDAAVSDPFDVVNTASIDVPDVVSVAL